MIVVDGAAWASRLTALYLPLDQNPCHVPHIVFIHQNQLHGRHHVGAATYLVRGKRADLQVPWSQLLSMPCVEL